ncbi:MAG: galactokinase [Actinobacteria bacterium]|nr:galactokinase [Actinomycetota bacterium]NCV95986.1 galactokinase [Actinomycetota bacterium]
MNIREDFAKLFGLNPDLVSSAPGRVNLIGEHIDYSDGFVLPFAIQARTYCALRIRSDERIRVATNQHKRDIFESSISELKTQTGPVWSRYILGVLWALGIKVGVEILVDSEVPSGAGLSSSAALECSVAIALNHHLELGRSLTELARITQRAENEYVGVPCGIMDQSISLMGRAGHALLLDCRDLSTRQIKVDFESHDLKLLIVDTRAHHALADGGYAERRAQCESVAKALGVRAMRDLSLGELEAARTRLPDVNYKRARHAVTEISRVLEAVKVLEADDFSNFGDLLTKSHQSLRDDYNVSCPELDLAVDTALNLGALGARMVGGGFGGSAIALIRSDDAAKVALGIEQAFEKRGFSSPRFFDSLPGDGARVESY